MPRTFEPPISEQGSVVLGPQPWAPGVWGRAFTVGPCISIPMLETVDVPTAERFIDTLSDRCVFASVHAVSFRRLLKRKGYVCNVTHWADGLHPERRQKFWMRKGAFELLHGLGHATHDEDA